MSNCGTKDILMWIAELEKMTFSDAWSYESICDTAEYDYNRIFIAYMDEGGELVSCDYREYNGNSEKLCGYLISNVVADESELLRIAVLRKLRKCGYGQALMDQYIKDTACNRYFLEVRKGNSSARTLYEKMGYKEAGMRKAYYDKPVEDAVIYELDK